MSFLYRAFLYVTRKIGKSALLFAILFIIATLALIGISIGNATSQAQSNLRASLGGKFTVWPSMDPQNPYVKTEQFFEDGQFSIGFYNTEAVYPEMIDSIMKVDGIKFYNAELSWSPDADNFKLCKGSMVLPLEEKYKKMVNCIGVSDTEHNEFFTSGTIRLVKGKNLKQTDSYSAIISTDLAEKNGLMLGDKLRFRTAQGDSISSTASAGRLIELKIVGMFKVQGKCAPKGFQTPYDMTENWIFTDRDSAIEAAYGYTGKYHYCEANFYINDPSKLNEIVKKVKALKLNWVPYEINTYSESYKKAALPLERLGSLIHTLLIIIIIVSACILSLILTMWVRDRIHETGVLLSMGISKVNIIGQFLVEVMLIAVFAFGLAYFSGNTIAQNVGNTLMKQQTVQQEHDKSGGFAISLGTEQKKVGETPVEAEGPLDLDNPAPVENIKVEVTVDDLFELYRLGILIIILSVGISSVTVMRLKPREILSMMS